jgi:hypothetical protein
MPGRRNDGSIQSRATTFASQSRFLEEYARLGTITHACRAAHIDPKRHYEWMERDPSYVERFEVAKQEAIDTLEREARRRAVEGVEEPVGWYKGEPGGYVKRYSDLLLIFLLKGARPERYRDNYRIEHTGADGGPIKMETVPIDVESLPPDARRGILEILERVQSSLPSNGNGNGSGNESGNGDQTLQVPYRVLPGRPTSPLPTTYSEEGEEESETEEDT